MNQTHQRYKFRLDTLFRLELVTMSVLLFFAVTGLFTGCQRTLAPGGVYHQDQVLYETDNAITSMHDVLQTFITWEAQNRAALAQFPEIKKTADLLFDNGPSWFASAVALRDAYKLDPGAANKAALQTSLDIIRAALREAAAHMAAHQALAPPPVNK